MNASNLLMFIIICMIDAVIARILLRNLNYYLMSRGVYGIDVNKPTPVKVPEEGGVSLLIAFLFSGGLFTYVWNQDWVVAVLIPSALISFIGFIDHFRNIRPLPKLFYSFVIGTLNYLLLMDKTGFSIWQQILLLLLISFAFSIGTNAFNLLAGFNGIESGNTIISSLSLAVYYYVSGFEFAAGLLILLGISYLVIWDLNRYPARIFLGDSGTLLPMAVYIGVSVYTGHWLPLLFILAPHLINVVIKFFSTGISTRSDYDPLVFRDGKLHLPEKNYWSLIRLLIAATGPKTEQQIVNFVLGSEIIVCAAMLIVLLGR